mmetsp:Transcript_39272/g.113536  ORF Transcript_39272/g.113536 Transcript_39272/m.113536 type:complete len:132 (-) Transcript_39272:236-631(-)
MTFAAFGRWATPRNVALSPFNRNLAMNMQLTRGLASTPLLRLASEVRPPSGFPEQRLGGTSAAAIFGAGVSGVDDMSPSAKLVAALLAELSESDTSVVGDVIEILDISALTGMRTTSFGFSCSRRRIGSNF